MNELNLKLNDKLNENAYLASELNERAKDINAMNAEKNERILEAEKLIALLQHRKQEINSLNLRMTDLESRIKGIFLFNLIFSEFSFYKLFSNFKK